MKKAISSGGIVVRKENEELQILMIIFKDGTGLSFPKGHVEPGESLEQAALREVEEETGLTDLLIIKKLGMVNRPSIEDNGDKVMKDIHLFLMTSEDDQHLKADEDYGWFSIDEAINKMGFPEEARFLKDHRQELSSG